MQRPVRLAMLCSALALACSATVDPHADAYAQDPGGQCANGVDDDRDGFRDGADPQCRAGRAVEAPVDNPILVCSGEDLVLVDVVAAARRVRLLGIADPSLSGRTVQVVAGARTVARAIVKADGTFATTAPAPSRRAARTIRYQARLGGLRSLNLKLNRRAVTASAGLVRGKVVFSGRVTGVSGFRNPPVIELLGRSQGCGGASIVVARGHLTKDGRFRVTAAPFRRVAIAVYRARIRLRGTARTYTLPRAIRLN